MKSATVAGSRALLDLKPSAADLRTEFCAGLRARPRRLPCKFFYDDRGSRLFDRICELPEYYPTRTECGILADNAAAIAQRCGPGCLLVELGSGSSVKTRLLLDKLERPAGYMPVDISHTHLERAAAALARDYVALDILPVCADYRDVRRLPIDSFSAQRTTIFFPGSTIGNLEPADAAAFLRRIAVGCRAGDLLLIGVDLAKRRDLLEPAYNDASGVTAAFNRNLLERANRELGADFRVNAFAHEAIYNAGEGRIEMHLVSRRAQTVTIDGERYTFAPGERITTEYSYKYQPDVFVRLARTAGWDMAESWSDRRGWFGVFAFQLRSG